MRLLVPRNSDPPFVGWLTRSSYHCLMKAGVRVYEYLPPRKLHAKSIVIDDASAIIGSANLDHWGLVANHEVVLVAREPNLPANCAMRSSTICNARRNFSLRNGKNAACMSGCWKPSGGWHAACSLKGGWRAAVRLISLSTRQHSHTRPLPPSASGFRRWR